MALEPEITCDGKTHDVQIWLDDIPREPVERPDVISGAPPVDGVSGFQFKLAFDQSVVRIRDEGDVRLAPGLDQLAGADAHFTAAGPFIDNYAGYAFIGGLNLGIAADIRVVPEDNQPTPLPQPGGLDPFAAGQSILLFEVGVEVIGTGKTEVTLREPQLLSGVKHEYAPVEVESVTLAVPGDCAPVPSATPRVTPTATLVPPPTIAPPPAYEAVPGVPADQARPDCRADWLAASTAIGSLCFPAHWSVSSRIGSGVYGDALMVRDGAGGVFIGIERVQQTPVSSGAVTSIEAFCTVLSDAFGIPFHRGLVTLRSGDAEACRGDGDAGEAGVDPLYAFAEALDGRFLQIQVTQEDTDSTAQAETVLETLEYR